MNKKLLDIKKEKRAKKPSFLRRNFMKNKRTRVSGNWRAPIGLHNKLRRRRRGVGQWVMSGYRMPVAVRGMTVEGLLPTVVENPEQVQTLDAAKHAIVLQASMGKKKRHLVVAEAQKKKIKVIGIKDPAAYMKGIDDEMAARKKAKKEYKKVPVKEEKKTEEKKEKTEEKKAESLEDATKQEQMEKNKILTKRE
ncbi:hypothetical protein HZA99_04530 [Candidatus Woesearchaeota archaeon]|nr:hypothetical protein [Candidatus Woesearchaeota archaeon]